MWCIPQIDEEYRARMEEILELYERPLNPREPVVCIDRRRGIASPWDEACF